MQQRVKKIESLTCFIKILQNLNVTGTVHVSTVLLNDSMKLVAKR